MVKLMAKKYQEIAKIYMIQMIRADKSIWCIGDISIFVTTFCNINIDKYHIIIAEHLNADTANEYISTLICMYAQNQYILGNLYCIWDQKVNKSIGTDYSIEYKIDARPVMHNWHNCINQGNLILYWELMWSSLFCGCCCICMYLM